MPSSCASCSHWDADNAGTRGVCRRHAPRVASLLIGSVEPELMPVWPVTSRADRCGDWRPVSTAGGYAQERQSASATIASGNRGR